MPANTGSIVVLFLLIANTGCGQFSFAPLPASALCSSAPNCQTSLPSAREKALMSSGLVTKNSACVMCHTRVSGNVAGFGTMTFRDDSLGQILGNLYAADIKLQRWVSDSAGTHLDSTFVDSFSDPRLILSVLPELQSFNLLSDGSGNFSVIPGEKHNTFAGISFLAGGDYFSMTSNDPAKRELASSHLIRDTFGNRPIIHEADFPMLNPDSCIGSTSGNFRTSDGGVLTSPLVGNFVLVNGQRLSGIDPLSAANSFNRFDPGCPSSKTLTVTGEVVVKGDLVLAGCIRGQGTIYVEGNIYIPDDIRLVNSPFPFPASVDDATLAADVAAKTGRDMLSLGSTQFVVIGLPDLNILTNPEQDPIFTTNAGMIANLYNWLSSGSVAQNQNLYATSFAKRALDGHSAFQGNAITHSAGAVSLVEANLYANMGVVATMIGSKNTNIDVNGSVMTPNLVMLSTGWQYQHFDGSGNPMASNPFNNQNFDMSQLNQDYRLKYTRQGYECHRIQTL